MIDLKPEILKALRGNAALVSLLGKDKNNQVKIYPEVAPDHVIEPYMTFFEITNFDGRYADDVPMNNEIHLHMDIFSKGNTFPCASEVDKTMKMNGFTRTAAHDQYEFGTKTYHKVLRYKKIIYLEGDSS